MNKKGKADINCLQGTKENAPRKPLDASKKVHTQVYIKTSEFIMSKYKRSHLNAIE